MFIIFGFRRRASRLGIVFMMCDFCHTPAANAITRVRRYFTLFFIPVIPVGTKYSRTCTLCGRSTSISKEAADQLIESAQRANGSPNSASASSPSVPNTSIDSSSHPAPPSVPSLGTARPPEPPNGDRANMVYCSWCGKQRATNAPAIHHCGSRERPAVYCMNCGTVLQAGALACASCGTPTATLSPR
jgi:hypothetical protein